MDDLALYFSPLFLISLFSLSYFRYAILLAAAIAKRFGMCDYVQSDTVFVIQPRQKCQILKLLLVSSENAMASSLAEATMQKCGNTKHSPYQFDRLLFASQTQLSPVVYVYSNILDGTIKL